MIIDSMFRQLILFLLLISLTGLLYGQQNQTIVSDIILTPAARTSEQMLPFEGEGEIREGLPVFRFRVPVSQSVIPESIKVAFNNLIWTADNDQFIASYPSVFKPIDFNLITIRKETFVEVELIPYRIIDNIPQRLSAFTYNISYQTTHQSELKSSSTSDKYATNSILASGKWLKIAVNETGIHKIPYATLTSWGFSTPSNVRIFGFGGEMVPRVNSAPSPDDLPELAIWHFNNAIYFFARGPVTWKWSDEKNMFIHQIHEYSDESFYFLTDLNGPGKTIQNQTPETADANFTSNQFDDIKYHERELNNLLRSGRRWYGERFTPSETLTRDFNFTFPTRDVTKPVKISSRIVCRDNIESTFEYRINNQLTPVLSLTTPAISFNDYVGFYAHEREGIGYFIDDKTDLKVSVILLNTNNTATGWLDFITMNVRSNLQLSGSQLLFRDKESQGVGNTTLFRISNASEETVVWDVTNQTAVTRIASTRNGANLEFKVSTTELKEFVAFNTSGQFPVPSRVGPVDNQNLHATGAIDYVIVAPKEFSSQAQQLAALHNQYSELSTLVVHPEAIYNEFSWGHKDPTAIRSFLKMLYDRDQGDISKTPKYLLLFGNGSFDNRTSDAATKSHIITYQSENSIHRTNTYVTDDYFGFLDDIEGSDDRYDRPDIGIGRFPVKNVQEAQTAVNKVKSYLTEQSPGKWKKLVTFIGDDEDSNIHMRDANLLAGKVENNHPQFDVRKIYLDNYEKITTSTGKRFPDVDNLVNRTISEGTLIFNYVGHGSENVLAAEQIVNVAGIKKWTNINRLPVFVTATCEFSRFDNPYLTSAGEEVFLNPQGGAIALLSTTRIVYSSLNYQLNNAFFTYVFQHQSNGEKRALGDILRLTKNASGNSINKLNFTLLGDPALKLIYPNNQINLIKINNKPISETPDTLKALSRIRLEAEVAAPDGTRLTSFNGTAEITVYDKPMNVKTLGNDGATPFEFSQYSSVLFKGKATVTNGTFTSEFIVPYDIRYNFAKGRISFYAFSAESGEAIGASNDIVVGGFDLSAPDDFDGPEVELYLNHTSFKAGDKIGAAPMLYAKIRDNSGINTSGTGIGHDILLVIDDKKNQPIILNNYFQATSDSYKEGMIIYQLPPLSKGKHEISLKVWDTYNNSTTAETYFVVGDNNDLDVRNFILHPNPVTIGGTLRFSMEVDEPNASFTITAESITTMGSAIASPKVQIVASGNFIEPIPLSLSALGIKAPGIYFIRFIISSSTGKKGQVVQKIMVRP